jgi:transcriptional regulator with XRE-family HTH domain
MLSEEQRRLLGRFIRSHRERVAPSVPTRRRRTPGLRREELAALAGIGVTWCAWIEQGRDIRVSPEALARLATALALTPAERGYLFELAGRRDPDAPRSEPMPQAPRSVRALVEAQAHPAYGLDRVWNACCWNAAAEHLFGGWLGPGKQKNLLRYAFTDRRHASSCQTGKTAPPGCWPNSAPTMPALWTMRRWRNWWRR